MNMTEQQRYSLQTGRRNNIYCAGVVREVAPGHFEVGRRPGIGSQTCRVIHGQTCRRNNVLCDIDRLP